LRIHLQPARARVEGGRFIKLDFAGLGIDSPDMVGPELCKIDVIVRVGVETVDRIGPFPWELLERLEGFVISGLQIEPLDSLMTGDLSTAYCKPSMSN